MSFIVELHVDALTDRDGRAIEARCAASSAWPLEYRPARRRRFGLFGRRHTGPGLSVPDEGDLLSDDALDGPVWALDPAAARRFARAIEILGEELGQGFVLRAYWVGARIRAESRLTAEALAELTRASKLDEEVRYVVPPGEGRPERDVRSVGLILEKAEAGRALGPARERRRRAIRRRLATDSGLGAF